MATPEQRWVAVRKQHSGVFLSFSVWLSDIRAHLSAGCTDALQPLMRGRTSETERGEMRASSVFESPAAMTLVTLKFFVFVFFLGKIKQQAGGSR